VASGYGSKPDWSAFGGHGADVEVVVRFQWRLVLDSVNPHLIGHVPAAHNPVAPRPQMHVCPLQSSQSTPEAPRSHPPKGVGFPDPLSGTLNQLVHAEVKNLLKLLVIDYVVRIAGVKRGNGEQDHD